MDSKDVDQKISSEPPNGQRPSIDHKLEQLSLLNEMNLSSSIEEDGALSPETMTQIWKDMQEAELLMDSMENRVNGVLSRIDELLGQVSSQEEWKAPVTEANDDAAQR